MTSVLPIRAGRVARWMDQPVQGPVEAPEDVRARSSAARTSAFGTPKPPRGPEVVAANTVVTTRPWESTIGPPELPERTAPRKDVIERRTGPCPYASWVMTSRVAPIRPARTSYGPLPAKPRIAAAVPDLGDCT